MIRVLHTADLHLDSPLRSLALIDPDLADQVRTASRAALASLVDTALDEEVAAVLIAGDLFDSSVRSARTAAFLTLQFDRLRAGGIRVFCIRGNHDARSPLGGDMRLPDNVHVFGPRGGSAELATDVWVHGVSFARPQAPESLLPRFPAPVPGAVNIAMLHTSLGGAEGHDPYAPCSVADLAAAGFDYWALGHVHRRQIHATRPWIVMPGTPQGRDMGEAGPKSATLVTIGASISVAEVPTSVVEFRTQSLAIGPTDEPDRLRDRLRQSCHRIAADLSSAVGVIRLVLRGSTPARWQLLRDRDQWHEIARDCARETGRLWLERLEMDLTDPTPPGQDAADELAALMAAIRNEPAFAHACRATIAETLAELPPPVRAALLPDADAEDRLARSLALSGADRILARFRGALS